jgi:hypothetical protein
MVSVSGKLPTQTTIAATNTKDADDNIICYAYRGKEFHHVIIRGGIEYNSGCHFRYSLSDSPHKTKLALVWNFKFLSKQEAEDTFLTAFGISLDMAIKKDKAKGVLGLYANPDLILDIAGAE